MSNLYDTDFHDWAEQQARLLRRHAAGKPVNDDDLDPTSTVWPVSSRESVVADRGMISAASIAALEAKGIDHIPWRARADAA